VGSLEGHTAEVKALAFLSENLVASGSFDRTVRVWDLCTGQCIRVFEGHTAKVWCVEKVPPFRSSHHHHLSIYLLFVALIHLYSRPRKNAWRAAVRTA
jgi:WD40 repeat protein